MRAWSSWKGSQDSLNSLKKGTIHAIGKGNLIAKIQQNSNVTYRLYDYGRIGKDGKPRELHIEKGVAASNCKKTQMPQISVCSDDSRLLANCKCFAVRELKLIGSKDLCADEKSYHALVVTEGDVRLESLKNTLEIKTGETVFVPAGVGKYTIYGNATVLLTTNQV